MDIGLIVLWLYAIQYMCHPPDGANGITIVACSNYGVVNKKMKEWFIFCLRNFQISGYYFFITFHSFLIYHYGLKINSKTYCHLAKFDAKTFLCG